MSRLIHLRNTFSNILFENKHTMQENTYKILYESLAIQTKSVSCWCKISYAKATIQYDDDDFKPKLSVHHRNVYITEDMCNSIAKEIRSNTRNSCTFYNIISENSDITKDFLRRQLDEPLLFNDTEAFFVVFGIIQIDSWVIGS